MRKLLSGSAVFMFLLVIMAGSASAEGVSLINPSIIYGVVGTIINTLVGVIEKHLLIISVLAALAMVIQMLQPSEAELAYAESEDEYEEYAEKMERKAAFRERFENEHWNDDF